MNGHTDPVLINTSGIVAFLGVRDGICKYMLPLTIAMQQGASIVPVWRLSQQDVSASVVA